MSTRRASHLQPTRTILRSLASLSATWGKSFLKGWRETSAYPGIFLQWTKTSASVPPLRQETSRKRWSLLLLKNARWFVSRKKVCCINFWMILLSSVSRIAYPTVRKPDIQPQFLHHPSVNVTSGLLASILSVILLWIKMLELVLQQCIHKCGLRVLWNNTSILLSFKCNQIFN